VTTPDATLTSRGIALVCAVVALVAGLVAAGVSMWAAGGDTSALVRVPSEEPLGHYVEHLYDDWDFVEPATRYDGLYYYTIAIDPLARGLEHGLIDAPAYRYGHPGHGWLAMALSLGSDASLPVALLLLGALGITLAAYAASRLAAHLDLTPWLGLLVAVNPGLLYAMTVDTPETTGAAVLGLGLLAWLRNRVWLAAASFVLLCLIKEAFVFVPLGIGLYELVLYARGRREHDLIYRLGLLALGPLALAAWFAYLHGELGVWSFADGPENLSFPIAGWVETLRLAGLQQQGFEFQVGAASLPMLVALAVVLVTGIASAARFRTPIDAIFIPSALLIFCLSWLALLYPKDMWRNVSAVLYLLPFVLLAGSAAGQLEVEDGAAAELALDPDPPPVTFDDEAGQV
jgi:hypothetical protein